MCRILAPAAPKISGPAEFERHRVQLWCYPLPLWQVSTIVCRSPSYENLLVYASHETVRQQQKFWRPTLYLLQDIAFRPSTTVERCSLNFTKLFLKKALSDIDSIMEFATYAEQIIKSKIRKQLSGSGQGGMAVQLHKYYFQYIVHVFAQYICIWSVPRDYYSLISTLPSAKHLFPDT